MSWRVRFILPVQWKYKIWHLFLIHTHIYAQILKTTNICKISQIQSLLHWYVRVATQTRYQNSLTFPWPFPDLSAFFPDQSNIQILIYLRIHMMIYLNNRFVHAPVYVLSSKSLWIKANSEWSALKNMMRAPKARAEFFLDMPIDHHNLLWNINFPKFSWLFLNFPDFQQNSKFPWQILKFPDFSLTLNFPDFSLTSGNPVRSLSYEHR